MIQFLHLITRSQQLSDQHRKFTKEAKQGSHREVEDEGNDNRESLTEAERKKLEKKKQADQFNTDDEKVEEELGVKEKKKKKVVKAVEQRETSCDRKLREEEEKRKRKEQKKAERLKLQRELEEKLKEEEEWERRHQEELERAKQENQRVEDSMPKKDENEVKKKSGVERQPRRLPSKGGIGQSAQGRPTDHPQPIRNSKVSGDIVAEDIDSDDVQENKTEVIHHSVTQTQSTGDGTNQPKAKKLIQPQIKFGQKTVVEPTTKEQANLFKPRAPQGIDRKNDSDSDISIEREKVSKPPIKSTSNANDWAIDSGTVTSKPKTIPPFLKGKITTQLPAKGQSKIDSDDEDWDS